MKWIGIAGGSGAGKSTVSYELIDTYPDMFEVLNLDDYQKLKTDENLPMVDGMINWDHPEIIRWDDLTRDMHTLSRGEAITIDTWSHRTNPDYAVHHTMKSRTLTPKPIMILEGYLALHNPSVVKLLDKTYYLDLDDDTRSARRGKGTFTGKNVYETKVLIPMHRQFVAPTKTIADRIIDVRTISAKDAAQTIARELLT